MGMSVFWMYAIPASPFGGTALSWPMMGPHATLGVWGAAGAGVYAPREEPRYCCQPLEYCCQSAVVS